MNLLHVGMVRDPATGRWRLDPAKKHWGWAVFALLQGLFWGSMFVAWTLSGEGAFPLVMAGLAFGVGFFAASGLLREQGKVATVCHYLGAACIVAGLAFALLWMAVNSPSPCYTDSVTGEVICD